MRRHLASSVQEDLFFRHLRTGRSYVVVTAVPVPHATETPAIERAIAEAALAHPALRTAFALEHGRLYQCVAPAPCVAFEQTEEPLDALVARVRSTPRPLDAPDLVRFHELRHGDRRLAVSFPHILLDGASSVELLRAVLGESSAGASAPDAYFEHCADDARATDTPGAIAFWRGLLEPATRELSAPARAGAFAHAGSVEKTLDAPAVAEIDRVAAELRVSRALVLRAAWGQFLLDYFDEGRALVVHEVINVRPPKVQKALGNFYRVSPVLFAGECSLAERVKALRSWHLRYLKNPVSEQALSEIVGAAEPRLFFAYNDFLSIDGAVNAEVFDEVDPSELHLVVDDCGARLDLRLFHPGGARVDRAVLDRFVSHLSGELRGSAGSIVLKGERPWIERKSTGDDTAAAELVTAQFRRVAAARKNETAVKDAAHTFTFGELAARSGELRARLAPAGARDEVVLVYLERSAELYAALVAIMDAGASFLVVYPSTPRAYVASILLRARPRRVVTRKRYLERLPVHRPGDHQPEIVVCLEDSPARGEAPRGEVEVDPSSGAYAVFTSGSTGQPKGVLNTHRGLANRIDWMQRCYPIGPGDVVLHKTPASFDVAVWEYVWPLCTGAAAYVAPPDAHKDPWALIDIIDSERVTVVHFVPSMLRHFLDATRDRGLPGSLRHVFASGEVLDAKLVREFHAQNRTGARLHNLYGPAEAAIDVTRYECLAPGDPDADTPIGSPVSNTQMWVLDRRQNLRPPGFLGEIFIGGVQVARGYLADEQQTKSRFVTHPLLSRAPLYRTGDLGWYDEDGLLHFVGRADSQVKIRGVRIELASLESMLEAHPRISQAAVVRVGVESGEDYLAAFVRVNDGERLDASEVRSYLAEKVPTEVIPARVRVLESFPTTENGKLDRKALLRELSALSERPPELSAEATASPLDRVRAIFTRVLGRNVRAMDNFFDRGGDSLSALRVVAEIRRTYGVELSALEFLENPTPEGVLAALAGQDRGPAVGLADLSRDLRLGASLSPPPRTRPIVTRPKQIFLTGATGFLGAFVLRDLLLSSDAEVVCLTRAQDPVHARARLVAAATRFELDRDVLPHLSRVRALPGDASAERFGLSFGDYRALENEADSVIHAAAEVSFVLPYEALRPANVIGTERILRFACRGQPKELHFVSTLSAVAEAWTPGQAAITEDSVAAPFELASPYARSKAVAEMLVRQASERGLRASIYRPGRIAGDPVTGACQSEDLLWLLVEACRALGKAPDVDSVVDLVPVTAVSAAIAWGCLERHEATFHMFGDPRPFREIAELMQRAGTISELASWQDWYRAALESRARPAQLAASLFTEATPPELCPVGLRVDSQRSRALLTRHARSLEASTVDEIDRSLRFLCRAAEDT